MPKPRAVLCLSGGMDSCVCAALAARDFDVFALHVSYGQRTQARELLAAQDVARLTHAAGWMHLKTDLFRQIGGSALTDPQIPIPDAVANQLTGPEIPVTYVPFRNANLLAAAVSWAEVLDASTILLGAVEQDGSGYPDCRPAFYDAFNQLILAGARNRDIRVQTPLIAMRKHQIVSLGVELRAPFHVSWSCYASESQACGVCESCALRLKAFREAGAIDPIPYREPVVR